ncbi:hypothetical protein FOCC_FOCC014723 [Frankliniella occidentalis]|nr:hypothetical protein FOCC_FOCC014723 [Frankliniella occidentalis]
MNGLQMVLQSYEVAVVSQPVTRGNAAVLRCSVPSLVRDYVAVTSWLQDQSFNIFPSKEGGIRGIAVDETGTAQERVRRDHLRTNRPFQGAIGPDHFKTLGRLSTNPEQWFQDT